MNRFFLILVVFIASCNETEDRILTAHGYLYDSKGENGRCIYSQNTAGKTFIFGDITDYFASDSFILARQIPSKTFYKNFLGFTLYQRFLARESYLGASPVERMTDSLRFVAVAKDDSINYGLFKARGASDQNTAKDSKIYQDIADSLLEHDPWYQKILSADENYWIIQISKDTLFGPFSKAEYLKEKVRLHIPQENKLKFEK